MVFMLNNSAILRLAEICTMLRFKLSVYSVLICDFSLVADSCETAFRHIHYCSKVGANSYYLLQIYIFFLGRREGDGV